MSDNRSLADGLRALLRGDEISDAVRRRVLTAAAWELEVTADTMDALDAENARLKDLVTILRARLGDAPNR